MPRQIEELSPAKPRGNTKYQWDEWAVAGNRFAFVRGTDEQVEAGEADFSCKPSSFEVQARSAAADRGLSTSVRTPDANTVEVEFQAQAQAKPEATDTDESTEVDSDEEDTEES